MLGMVCHSKFLSSSDQCLVNPRSGMEVGILAGDPREVRWVILLVRGVGWPREHVQVIVIELSAAKHYCARKTE